MSNRYAAGSRSGPESVRVGVDNANRYLHDRRHAERAGSRCARDLSLQLIVRNPFNREDSKGGHAGHSGNAGRKIVSVNLCETDANHIFAVDALNRCRLVGRRGRLGQSSFDLNFQCIEIGAEFRCEIFRFLFDRFGPKRLHGWRGEAVITAGRRRLVAVVGRFKI